MHKEGAAAGRRSSSSSSGSNESWVISISEGLVKEIKGYADTKQNHNSHSNIFRVPKHVKNREEVKGTSFYTPEGISLGLFHRPGRYEAPIRGQKFKQKMAAAFLTEVFKKEDNRNLALAWVKTNLAFPESESRPLLSNGEIIGNRPADNESIAEQGAEQASVKFLTSGLGRHAWRYLCYRLVEREFGNYRKSYDLREDDLLKDDEDMEVLKWELTLDAIVVGCFFLEHSYMGEDRSCPFLLIKNCARERANGRMPVDDFLKLENQIPLELPRNVLRLLRAEDITGDGDLNRACALFARYFVKYLPGYDLAYDLPYIDHLKETGKFIKCHHLLDCVVRVLRRPEKSDEETNEGQSRAKSGKAWPINRPNGVAECIGNVWGPLSRAMKMKRDHLLGTMRGWWLKGNRARVAAWSTTSKDEPSPFFIPSATLLREAGIELRGRSRGPISDLLPEFQPGWLKATLYIPSLPILPVVTWTLWRNILVYENGKNRRNRKKIPRESQMHAYLALMGCLVDTKEDVLLFTKGAHPVLPEGYHSTPENLAEMFNTILSGLPYAEYQRWGVLASKVNKYRNHKYRRLILDFYRTYLGKPWLIISVLAASALLGLAIIQATYAILAYKLQQTQSPSDPPPQ